jgi:hypothetical protein
MKSLVWLSLEVLKDFGTRCGVDVARDCVTVTRRTEDEGESFLTISLPDYCKAFERMLDSGLCLASCLPGFRFGRTGLPRFLGGFLARIFGADGRLLDVPDVDCIFAVRQVCLLVKKVKLPCTEERNRAAQQQYVESDRKCGYPSEPEHQLEGASGCGVRASVVRESFRAVGSRIASSILRGSPYGLPNGYPRARHGPGTNTNGLLGNSKWTFPYWPERVERYFPRLEYAWGSYSDALDRECEIWAERDSSDDVGGAKESGLSPDRSASPKGIATYPLLVSPEQEPPVKVIFVPKTLKTPRVIASESSVMQYAQQATMGWLVGCIEASELTAGRVNFTDQSINQKFARLGSRGGGFATIDMKEASDLVSLEHVKDLFHGAPNTLGLLEACRTTRAQLPSGETIHLRKFASMGSAICFPVEALVFFTACVAARIQYAGRTVSNYSVRKYSNGVFVYGDDIIVPANEAPAVCSYLEACGFKVNATKSFWTGKFRESCGKDWYDGHDVTPTYVRLPFPADRHDANGIVSWVATANQLFMAGLWRAASLVESRIEALVGKLPLVTRDSSQLGWHTFRNCMSIQRWNKTLHRFEYRSWRPTPVYEPDPLDGYPALLKCWSIIGSKDTDELHLTRRARRSALTLKRRWAPSYA